MTQQPAWQKSQSGLSVVVCHGGEHRLPLLQASLQNIRNCSNIDELIVAEMSTSPCADDIARQWAHKYIFLPRKGPFERARALNVGAALASYDLILWRDNDLLMAPGFLEIAVKEMRAQNLDYLVPFHEVRYLSSGDSQAVVQEKRDPAACKPLNILRSEYHEGQTQLVGCMGMVKRDFLLRHGGLLEEFRGWGCEDDAWWYKACLLGRAECTRNSAQRLYHLFHSGSGGYQGPGNPASSQEYAANLAVLDKVYSVTDPETFRRRFFHPSRDSFRWSPKKVLFLFGIQDDNFENKAAQTARLLTNVAGVQIRQLKVAAADPGHETLLSAQNPDCVVIFDGCFAAKFLSDSSFEPFWQKTIVLLSDRDRLCEVEGLNKAGAICVSRAVGSELEKGGLRTWRLPEGNRPDPAVLATTMLQPMSLILANEIPAVRTEKPRDRSSLRTAQIHDLCATRSRKGQARLAGTQAEPGLLLTYPILKRMQPIEGWLEEEEADLLIAATAASIIQLPKPHAVVEVGSYCGRSTVVLGSVVKTLRRGNRMYAIDPHEGTVGAQDQEIQRMAPTHKKLMHNLAIAGLSDTVTICPTYSWNVKWKKPIGLLFIDGLHDYANVTRDFRHFEPWLVKGAYIAFHDYSDCFPGVKRFVNALVGGGSYQQVGYAGSMIVLSKNSDGGTVVSHRQLGHSNRTELLTSGGD